MKQRAEWSARTQGTLGTHLGTLSAHLLGAFLPTHDEAARRHGLRALREVVE